MTIANVSPRSDSRLPQGLRSAQDAINLPEVQEMLRRLSEYKLGIFMPHMHEERTGEFQLLPDEVIQVESGLEVSFQPMEEIANQTDRFLPVGWVWRAGASTPLQCAKWFRKKERAIREIQSAPSNIRCLKETSGVFQLPGRLHYIDKDERLIPYGSAKCLRIPQLKPRKRRACKVIGDVIWRTTKEAR